MEPEYIKQDLENKTFPLIPRRVLFGNPDKAKVNMSHDGEYISYMAPKNGVLNVFIAPYDNFNQAEAITNEIEKGVLDYWWSYNNKHIIFTKDYKGDENKKIYSYNLLTKTIKLLTPEHEVKANMVHQTDLIPDEILVAYNDRNPKYYDVHKINLETGENTLIFENNQYRTFIADYKLNIRFASLIDSDGGTKYFEYINGKFISFLNISFEDSMTTEMLWMDKTGDNIYLLDSRDRNTSALTKLNLTTGHTFIISETPKVDLTILTTHPTEHTIQGVNEIYTRQHCIILDDQIKTDIDYLKSFSTGELNIIARTLNDKKWLVSYWNDNYPIKYYSYQPELETLSYLFSNRVALEDHKLSPMYPLVIPTDDGLELVSYLTLPKSEIITSGPIQIDHPIPLVLYVHGGPWYRDEWGLDLIHQWLADRGYAALSVNYRGSLGFGKDFCNAGNLEWGKKMHQDLITAVKWSIDNGITEAGKIAIYGVSYGGYAALTGLTATPETFACAISNVGISNLISFITSAPKYWASCLEDLRKRIGDWETVEGRAALIEASPVTHVDKITKPLLLGQGDNDQRVTKSESDQIYDAMISKGLPVIYLNYPDEGHGFTKAGNRESFIAVMEEFLAKILGGKLEPLTQSDFEGANFLLNGQALESSCAGEVIHQLINTEKGEA